MDRSQHRAGRSRLAERASSQVSAHRQPGTHVRPQSSPCCTAPVWLHAIRAHACVVHCV